MSRILINDGLKPRTVLFGDIISNPEAQSLKEFVASATSKSGPIELQGSTPHRAVLAWLNARPEILKRWKALEILPDYGAYLLEYHLLLRGAS